MPVGNRVIKCVLVDVIGLINAAFPLLQKILDDARGIGSSPLLQCLVMA